MCYSPLSEVIYRLKSALKDKIIGTGNADLLVTASILTKFGSGFEI